MGIPRKSHHKGFKPSKKVAKWNALRAKIKKQFEAKGITRCQMCGRSDYLSFSHRLKRRYITDDTELAVVALLCMDNPDRQGCHNLLEFGEKDVMYSTVTRLHEEFLNL